MACENERQPFLDDDTDAMVADLSRSLDAKNTKLLRRRYKEILSKQTNCLRHQLDQSTPATPKSSNRSQRSGRCRPCVSANRSNVNNRSDVNNRSRNFYDTPPSIFQPQASSTLRDIHLQGCERPAPAPCFSSSEPDLECEEPCPAGRTYTVPGPERTNQRMAPGPCADTSVKSSVYHTGPLELSSTTRYPNTSLNTTSRSTKANTIDLCSTEATIKDVSNTSAHVSNKSAFSNTCGSERRQPCTTRSPCPVVQPSGLSITIWLIILVIALLCSYLGSLVAYQVCRKAGYCGCTRDATVKYVPF